ncbi:hypothetical protein SCLCIDRAFT_1062394 [Scleroderma citrinum Foug A]|uniref:Uncharacterized protein n=1 Tax=Scleroderma citrinum Foug A TaxID=1036808 RepID=A0A0C3DRW9_9AGAM|nr:hypothetical protein SCLCIDRAFT_1062394 [Scleroderma citrinum Foug A]
MRAPLIELNSMVMARNRSTARCSIPCRQSSVNIFHGFQTACVIPIFYRSYSEDRFRCNLPAGSLESSIHEWSQARLLAACTPARKSVISHALSSTLCPLAFPEQCLHQVLCSSAVGNRCIDGDGT